MANKLKEMFSDENIEYIANFNFNSQEDRDTFFEKLNACLKDGKTRTISGLEGIEYIIKDYNSSYTVKSEYNLKNIKIEPRGIETKIQLNTMEGKCDFSFLAFYSKDYLRISNLPEAIFEFDIVYNIIEKKTKLNYKIKISVAKDILQVINAYADAIAFFELVFDKTSDIQINEIINEFKLSYYFGNRLRIVMNNLNIKVESSKIELTEEETLNVEKLYFLLIEKKCIKISNKINFVDRTFNNAETNDIKEGSKMLLAYIEEEEILLLGNIIKIFLVEVVINAIVDKIDMKDEKIRVNFKDTDSAPMYISCSGYTDEDEAKKELSNFIDKIEQYKMADTLYDGILKLDSEIKNK